MSVTPSAELISQGMSIYEALISAINSDKARRFANLIGSSFRLLGNEDVRDLLKSRILYAAFMHCVFLMTVTSLPPHKTRPLYSRLYLGPPLAIKETPQPFCDKFPLCTGLQVNSA